MTSAAPIGHEQLASLARHLQLSTSASELHGSLCGCLAGGLQPARGTVLQALALDGAAATPSAADEDLMARLVQQCAQAFDDADLAFEPLLPGEDDPLAERAGELAAWCRGFLGGFGLAGAPAQAAFSAEAQEVLRDLGAIASARLDFGDEAEDEESLAELHEFVRVGAMLLYAECARRPDPSGRMH